MDDRNGWLAWIGICAVLCGIPSGSMAAESEAPEEPGAEHQASGGGETANGLRSVSVGAGTGFLVGLDTYMGIHDRLGIDAFVWRDPLISGCEPTCYRRTEFRVHWTHASGRRLINGGLMVGFAGGWFNDRVSARDTRSGTYVGPVVGVRGSYTPSPGFGIGANIGVNPSYFTGNERVAAPEPSPTSGFRLGVSAALVFEFGNPRSPTAAD